MRVIKRSKKEAERFKVLRPFGLNGKTVQVDSTIEIKDSGMQLMLCQKGSIIPADLPDVGEYISTRGFTLPGHETAFTCAILEIVQLLSDDALRLMLSGDVIPKDKNQWRPLNRKLRGTGK